MKAQEITKWPSFYSLDKPITNSETAWDVSTHKQQPLQQSQN